MRFGDYIRDVRRGLNWTQPEAARVIGIEQSYLSKIESGKSYPSEEVFSAILDRYSIELRDLTQALYAAELDRLREIAQVRNLILKSEQHLKKRINKLLAIGTLALALGGACLGAASLSGEREQVFYQYRLVGSEAKSSDLNPTQARDTAAPSARATTDPENARSPFIYLKDYRDVVFTEETEEGTQSWRLIGGTTRSVRSPLRWFVIPGTALIFCALGLFFVTYRLR